MGQIEYLRQFIKSDNRIIDRITLESNGRDDIQPGIEPETGKFLSFLVYAAGAVKVLELGTGIANSSIWIGEALKQTGGTLYTVDNHPGTFKEAEKNIYDAELDKNVIIISGNAEDAVNEMLEKHADTFDLVFQDCGKYLYPMLHDKLVQLTKPGGIIIADDTLFSEIDNVRKNLGRYTDMYNRLVFSDSRLYSVILPVGHGLTLSFKRPQQVKNSSVTG